MLGEGEKLVERQETKPWDNIVDDVEEKVRQKSYRGDIAGKKGPVEVEFVLLGVSEEVERGEVEREEGESRGGEGEKRRAVQTDYA